MKPVRRVSFAILLAALSMLALTLVPSGPMSVRAASTIPDPLSSWNPRVSCTPVLVGIADITDLQSGESSFDASRFSPGITTSVAGGDAKRWLTAGLAPSGWVPPGPACSLSTAKGTNSLFVQINGVQWGSLANEDFSSSYGATNGGSLHPATGDTTFNLFDPTLIPAYSGSCTSAADPTCSSRIHAEIDHDWKAAGYCGPGTACDDRALMSQTTASSTLIDIQGFVYWDPDHIGDARHQFSGWEIHPLTAWRLSSTSPPGPISLSWSPSNPQIGQIVNFVASAPSAPASGFTLDFGDGTIASGASVSHIYLAPGVFSIEATLDDPQGIARVSRVVTVGSWNPQVPCAPVQTTLESVLGSVTVQRVPSNPNSLGADYSGGGYELAGAQVYGSNPSPWPFFKRDLQPVCSANGAASFVELHNVTVIDYNVANCGTTYAIDNGGGSYPNGWQSCDTTFVLVTPGFGDDATCPACYLHRIYSGVDRDWNASGAAPLPGPVEGERVDVQGFLYWNNNFLDAPWHSFTGWEVHPITAWRPTTPPTSASISFLPGTPTGGETVTFNATVSGGTGPYTLAWDFGDGTVATGNQVSHAYSPAAYNVHLAVTDALGALATAAQTVTVAGPPGYTLSASSPSLTVQIGKANSATIKLTSSLGFSGTVALTATAYPAGLNLDPDPPSLPLAPNGSVSAILTVSAGPNTSLGPYFVSVVGSSGSLTRRVLLQVNVVGPSFVLTTDASGLVLLGGRTGTVGVTVASFEGFTGNVNLAPPPAPAGIHLSFNQPGLSLAPGSVAKSILSVSVDPNSLAGNYPLIITGSAGPITRRATLVLTVTSDFAITSNPAGLTFQAGASRPLTVNLASLSFAGTISLTTIVSTPGLSVVTNPASLTFNPGETHGATLTMTSTIAGTYTVTVMAVGGSLAHSITIPVRVTDFSLTANPASLTVLAGSSGVFTVTLASLAGFTGNVNLALSPAPGGIHPNLSSPGILLSPGATANSQLTVSADRNALAGVYTLTISGSNGPTIRQAAITLTISSDFTMSANPTSITIVSGTSQSSQVNLNSLGFRGTIALSASTSDPALTATFNPVSLSFNPGENHASQLQVASRTAGTYAVTVTAVTGSTTHSVTVSVTVTDFTVSATAAKVSLAAGSTASSTITLTSLDGFSGSVNLGLSPAPAGFDLDLSTPSLVLISGGTGSDMLAISSTATSLPGNYVILLKATAGSLEYTVTITMIVTA